MNNSTIEEILDSAIQQIAQGKTLEAVLVQFPEHSKELSGILTMVTPAISLPKNTAPVPTRRRRYVSAIHVPWQVRLQKILRIALIPATAVFLFVGGAQFVIAAQHSLPGETLFPIKLAAERTRVAITTNQNDKAHLELTYSQKRLVDVQTVLDLENSSPDQQALALNELKAQTQKTFALVPTVATNNAINNNDNTLFESLIAINNRQKDLLQNLPAQEQTKEIASTALQITEDHEKTLTTLLAVVNEKTLVDLVDQEISITGSIQAVSISKNQITIDKDVFIVNDATAIKYGDKVLNLGNLPLKTKVTITGEKNAEGLIAEKIEVLVLGPIPATGEVKGATTKPVVVPTEPAEPTKEQPVPEEKTNPNTVTGGYIIEQFE